MLLYDGAETVIALVQFYIIRHELKINKIFLSGIPYLISGAIMLVCLKVIGHYFDPTIVNTIILVAGGGIIYTGSLLIMRDRFFIDNIKSLINMVLKKEKPQNE